MMNRIIGKAETRLPAQDPLEVTTPHKKIVEIIGNLVYSAVALIPEKVDGIITATRSGYTPKWISKFRPPTNIYAVTSDRRVMRQLRLLWGVHPVQFEHDIEHVDDLVREAVKLVHQEGHVSDQKDIVFTSGVRMIRGRTNLLGVFHVEDLL